MSLLELEALKAGNVDDVVVRYDDAPSEFIQIRFTVDASTPLNSAYVLRTAAAKGTSMLQKFQASWETLKASDRRPQMMLVTNRSCDISCVAFCKLDGRTSLLVPAISQAPEAGPLGRLRQDWATHLSVSEEELVELLSHIQFRAGRPFAAEAEYAADLMAAVGLRSDPSALRLGIDRVRRWVVGGQRALSMSEVGDGIAELGISATSPGAILCVQQLAHDALASEATEALDWVDLFEGDSPAGRRRTVRVDAYDNVMQPDLEAAALRLANAGHHRVLVRGAMRLAAQFAVGAFLPKVNNFELARRQGPHVWHTDVEATAEADINFVEHYLGLGTDIALAVGVSADLTEDVLEYVRLAKLTVRTLVTASLAGGAGDSTVRDNPHAVAVAQAIRNGARRAVRGQDGSSLHLFLACPGALALLLGHRWNRVASTRVYEDLNGTYQPAFLVEA